MALTTWPGRWKSTLVLLAKFGPFEASDLCLRCRAQGYILPADLASADTCRGHLAEDRVNEVIREHSL